MHLVGMAVCRQTETNPHFILFVLFILHREELRNMRVTQFISDIAC